MKSNKKKITIALTGVLISGLITSVYSKPLSVKASDYYRESNLNNTHYEETYNNQEDSNENVNKEERLKSANLDIDAIKRATKLVPGHNSLSVEVPHVPGYSMDYEVFNNESNSLIDRGHVRRNIIPLPVVEEKTSFRLYIAIIDNYTNKKEGEYEIVLTFEDKVKPIIKYAYVQDSELHVGYEDNYVLDSQPLGYKISGEKEFHYINDDSIHVNVGDKIDIAIKDLFGNVTTQTFTINEENEVLYGKVPDDIVDDINDPNIKRLKNVDNFVFIDNKSEINLMDEFRKAINSNFTSRERNRLRFDGNGKRNSKKASFKFTEPGLYEIIAFDSEDNTNDLALYVYVRGEHLERSHIKNIEEIEKPLITSTKEVKAEYLVDIDWGRRVGEDKSTDGLLVIEPVYNDVLKFDDEFELVENKTNKLSIIDLNAEKSYSITVKHDSRNGKPLNNINSQANGGGQVNNNKIPLNPDVFNPSSDFVRYFYDVDPSFWASEDITRVTEVGLIHGYPNRYFLPQNNMSVREFLTVYGRFMAITPEDVKRPYSQDVQFKLQGNSKWGLVESKNVLGRIHPDKLKYFNITNLERNITRDEVAFIVANTINMSDGGVYSDFTDVNNTRYEQEINALKRDGRINGFPDDTFKPFKAITRAEVATFISNLF